MRKIYLLLIVSLLFYVNNIYPQSGTFDFTGATNPSGSSVVQTVTGVTMTIVDNNPTSLSWSIVDATLWGLTGFTGNIAQMNDGLKSSVTFSFSQAINVSTLRVANFDVGMGNPTLKFTPNAGSNYSITIDGDNGSAANVHFINITSFTITRTDGGSGNTFQLIFDNIVMDAALPVELTSFSAQPTGKMVILNWSTATEVKNYGFEVERIRNYELGITNWEKIGFVQGNGNSNSPKEYSFVDKTVSTGKYSYRLKQIDFDGQFEYSPVIDVQVDAPLAFALKQNYPNPFNPNTTIGYQLPNASHVALKVYDILGSELAVLVNGLQTAGDYEIPFDGETLNSGIYFYKLQTSDGFTAIKKLMLVK